MDRKIDNNDTPSDNIKNLVSEPDTKSELKSKKRLLKKRPVLKNSDSLKTEKIPRIFNYYDIDISDIPSHVNTVNKFILLHPEFFKTNVNKKMIYLHDNQIYNIYLAPVKFSDLIHNVKGYITTSLGDDTKFKMVLRIRATLKHKGAPLCYIKQLEIYNDNHSKYGDSVELYYNKILSDTMIKHCYYNQPAHQWEKDTKILCDEFFLSDRESLLAIINNKRNSINIGSMNDSWNNMVLHGPFGSGKSSFIYRAAMILKMSILSIDLSLYLNKKRELYALLHNQEFSLPNADSKEKQPAMNNYIIVLEEFDSAVEKLLDIEHIFKYKDVLKRNYLDLKNKELQSKISDFVPLHGQNDKVLEKVVIEKIVHQGDPENVNYEDFMDQMMIHDGIDMKNNKVLDKARAEILDAREHGNEMNGINAELNNIIKNMDDDNKSNVLRVSDLLELFSPSIPIKGRLIIATTNHLEKMRAAIPALFRAGRMTTVLFDYLDWTSLNQLTMYYFKQEMTLQEFTVTIPTSEIVELAIKYNLISADFIDFEQELKKRC